jgi:predicted transcriptional regulator
MKESAVKMLDDYDKEFAETLRGIGVAPKVAAIIAFLRSANKATAREIEMGTDLREPEVSTGTKFLRHEGWLMEEKLKNNRPGRPTKVYRLRAPVQELIDHLEEEKIRELNMARESIEKLRNLGTS